MMFCRNWYTNNNFVRVYKVLKSNGLCCKSVEVISISDHRTTNEKQPSTGIIIWFTFRHSIKHSLYNVWITFNNINIFFFLSRSKNLLYAYAFSITLKQYFDVTLERTRVAFWSIPRSIPSVTCDVFVRRFWLCSLLQKSKKKRHVRSFSLRSVRASGINTNTSSIDIYFADVEFNKFN